MENIDLNNKTNSTYDFEILDSFKIVIYSIIGITIFFIPISINGYVNTLIHHMALFIQERYIHLLKLYIVLMVIFGSIIPILKYDKKNNNEIVHNIITLLRPISILLVLIIFSQKEYYLHNNDSLLFMQEIILKYTIVFSLGVFFMPLITDYGLIEVTEGYFNKYTKKNLNLSGKSVLNVFVYLFVDVFTGMFMTNKLYKSGKLRQSEACIIISCFSFFSIMNSIYLADKLKIQSKAFTIIISIILSIIINSIVCRIWPLRQKKKSYFLKAKYKECNFKSNKFKKSIQRYLENKGKKKLIYCMIENFKESFNIIMTILPNLVIIIFVGEFIINNTGLVESISNILNPFIEALKLPGKSSLSEFICLGLFNGGRYIELVNNESTSITTLIMFIVLIGQTVSITTNVLYISSTDIPLKITELIIIGLEKVFITLIVISLIYYLFIGYI